MADKKPTTGRPGTERSTKADRPPSGPRAAPPADDRTAPSGDEYALERGETLPHHDAPSMEGPATPHVTDDDPEQLKRPRVGDTIGERGRFVVTETIGMGGMGIVCRARDQQLDRSVAIKFVQWNRQIPWGQLTALLRQEAKATAQLSHENIVAIFDIGAWGNVPFLVMEHLEGEPLSQLMRREQLTTERVLEIMIDVLAGLSHAHQANVIHRDLKPSNVFIVKGGRAKVLDFGLARIEHAAQLMADGSQLEDVLPHLTSAGTPPYMAPEQWRKHVQDARTDIWAAGVLLFEMLTGELPHGATM